MDQEQSTPEYRHVPHEVLATQETFQEGIIATSMPMFIQTIEIFKLYIHSFKELIENLTTPLRHRRAGPLLYGTPRLLHQPFGTDQPSAASTSSNLSIILEVWLTWKSTGGFSSSIRRKKKGGGEQGTLLPHHLRVRTQCKLMSEG